MAPAINSFHFTKAVEFKDIKPIGKVNRVLSVSTTIGQRMVFQAPIKFIIAIVAMAGKARGRYIIEYARNTPAPSSTDDSYNSCDKLLK